MTAHQILVKIMVIIFSKCIEPYASHHKSKCVNYSYVSSLILAGICIDEVNGFHCNCDKTGYSGTRCQDNENECKKKPNICLNNGICYDTYGSYVCECK